MIETNPFKRPASREYDPNIIPGKLIDGINIIEHICEVFDSAVELLPETAILYGGAVRDSLAGVPIAGDLDVLLTPEDLHYAVNDFVRSPRWILINGKTSYKDYEGISFDYTAIHSFKTVNDKVVQLIPSTTVDTAVITDIICCGVVSDVTGNVYEAVNGAYRDCQEMVLNINEMAYKVMSVENLSNRIDKLVKRGWKSNISMEVVAAEIEKIKIAEEKISARKRRSKTSMPIIGKNINLGKEVQRSPSNIYDRKTKPDIFGPIKWVDQEVDASVIGMPRPNKFKSNRVATMTEAPETESIRSKQMVVKRGLTTDVYKTAAFGEATHTKTGRISAEGTGPEITRMFNRRGLSKVTDIELVEFATSYLSELRNEAKINKTKKLDVSEAYPKDGINNGHKNS